MSETPSYFARKLTELRDQAGLSSYRLAQLAGISKQALSLLESGERQPNWQTVQRLARALGVSCEAFEDPGLEMPEAPPPGKAGRPRKERHEGPDQGEGRKSKRKEK